MLLVVFAFAVLFVLEENKCVEKKVAFAMMLFEFVKRLQHTLRISNKLKSERHSQTCYGATDKASNAG